MKRYLLTLLAGFFFLALSVASVAADDVKFACSHHGPKNMLLTLSLEKGDPQIIVIEGKNNGKQWFVTIDGRPAANGNGGQNGDTIKVHSGDTITWSISAATHGVAFADQKLAEAMFKELKAGDKLKLEDLTTTLTSADWKAFGKTLWGTKETNAVPGKTIVMVTGTVK